jgi:cobalamin synthase
MAHQLRLLLAALRVYTRVPFIARLHGVTSDVPTRAGDAIRYLPIAGLLVAIAQSVVYMFASIVLPHAVALLDSSPSLRMTGREMFISSHHPTVRRWFAVSE